MPQQQADQPSARGAVTAANAGTVVTLFGVAAALSIALTRVYLDLAGYPSVGGKVFHLAHALWGGLLLIIGSVLTLALRNGQRLQRLVNDLLDFASIEAGRLR